MFIRSRSVVLAAIAVSVLAGCQTTAPRDCDKTKPGITHNAKCCGIGDAPCKEGRNGDKSPSPDPEPQ